MGRRKRRRNHDAGPLPRDVDPSTARRIEQIALAAFQRTGCRDYARIDLRMDSTGQAYVLEINANPDIGPDAGFQRALRAAGISFEDFVDRLVHNAHERPPTDVRIRRVSLGSAVKLGSYFLSPKQPTVKSGINP